MSDTSISFHQTLVMYQNTVSYEPKISYDINSVTNRVGGTLVGLDSVLKPLSSVEDKICRASAARQADKDTIFRSFSDVIRYTCIFSREDIPDKVLVLLRELVNLGYAVIKIDNKFNNPKKYTHYKGLHFDLMSPDHIIFELQIHTRESYRTKVAMHPYYVITRDRSNHYTENQKKEALAIQQLAFDQLPDIPDLCLEEGYHEFNSMMKGITKTVIPFFIILFCCCHPDSLLHVIFLKMMHQEYKGTATRPLYLLHMDLLPCKPPHP